MKIVTADQMRRIEQECAAGGIPTSVLMENAGLAVAQEIAKLTGSVSTKRVLVLIGPGNNGGDGLVAARHLSDWGAGVNLYAGQPRSADDPNLALCQKRHIPMTIAGDDSRLAALGGLAAAADVVIDALFGTGKSRGITGVYQQILETVSAKVTRGKQKVVALDLPSGLDADSGAVDPACLAADFTITLGFPKPGLFRFPGAEKTGRLVTAGIGIPPRLADDITSELITDDWLKTVLPARPLSANKGTFGRVLVVAGSLNYIGAAHLAAMGAARTGAGLVTLAAPASLQSALAARMSEVTHIPLPEAAPGVIGPAALAAIEPALPDCRALLVGCGIGQHSGTVEFIEKLLDRVSHSTSPSLLLDADALNIIARHGQWWQKIYRDCCLTPHPGEMARLSGLTVNDIQADREGVAGRMARQWGKTVVLKGAFTVIAAPDGRTRLSGKANPGLASAGTGDVLAGAIAGLLAQGLPLFDAAAAGVSLHSKAGEMVRDELGDCGMLAGDILPQLPKAIKALKA